MHYIIGDVAPSAFSIEQFMVTYEFKNIRKSQEWYKCNICEPFESL